MTKTSPNRELEWLLNESVDGQLSDADEAALQVLLRDDPAARRRYLQFMQLHAELHWDHGASAALLVCSNDHTTETSRLVARSGKRLTGWTIFAIAFGAVAASVLLSLVYFGVRDAGDQGIALTAPTIATVEVVQGAVYFRAVGTDSPLVPDYLTSLPAGTLLVEGESSAAQLRFTDGTLITVSGNAEVRLNDDGQKLLRVRHGMLTAEVQPQPADAPLVIETPTTRVEVLGTVFTLAAELEWTRINVDQGRVRVRRLVDGQTVDVSQEHSCVVSLDARHELREERPSKPASGWRHRFTEPPPERWKGEWLPPDGDLPPRVRAAPCMVGRKHEADYQPIVHYGITARKVEGVDLGSLPADGSLRMKFRTEQPTPLQIMLGLNHADGRFGGNFEVKLPRDAGTRRSDGWRELIVPLADFRPIVERYPVMAERAQPYLILITTYGRDSGLEVTELAIVETELSQ